MVYTIGLNMYVMHGRNAYLPIIQTFHSVLILDPQYFQVDSGCLM